MDPDKLLLLFLTSSKDPGPYFSYVAQQSRPNVLLARLN